MTVAYRVAGMSCAHCTQAVEREVRAVPGVVAVEVDLGTNRVVVTGSGLDDAALRAAIGEAGYEAEA
jgi:copper chaperone CopZ